MRADNMSSPVTTVITVFNRAYCVATAIRSAISTFASGVVIVVDDASTDNLMEIITKEFYHEMNSGQLVFHRLGTNLGVTGAKNVGYSLAKSDWVLFLDSDDELIASEGNAILAELTTLRDTPIVFFRCKDQYGNFVGVTKNNNVLLDLQTYVEFGSFGEALTALNKRLLRQCAPYPAELLGYEGLGCCRIIRDFGPAILSSIVARVYHRGGDDSLSSFSGMLGRAKYLAIGHWTIASEFRFAMSRLHAWRFRIKAALYMLGHYLNPRR